MTDHISIDRKSKIDVNRYIQDALKELTKKKTRLLLNSYYQWYLKNPQRNCNGPPLLIMDKSFQSKRGAKDVLVFNDAYIRILIPFMRKYSQYSDELIKTASEIKDLNKKVGKYYTFGPVMTPRDMKLLKSIFKLLQKRTGRVRVIKTRAKHRIKYEITNTNFQQPDSSTPDPVPLNQNCHQIYKVDESLITDLEDKLKGLEISVKVMRTNKH